jgi:hypothetical protein
VRARLAKAKRLCSRLKRGVGRHEGEEGNTRHSPVPPRQVAMDSSIVLWFHRVAMASAVQFAGRRSINCNRRVRSVVNIGLGIDLPHSAPSPTMGQHRVGHCVRRRSRVVHE